MTYNLYFGTVDYYATGEGVTRAVFITQAETKEKFLNLFEKELNEYHVRGAKVWENQIPICPVYSSMVSEALKVYIGEYLDGKQPVGYLKYFLHFHNNLS